MVVFLVGNRTIWNKVDKKVAFGEVVKVNFVTLENTTKMYVLWVV